MLTVTLTVFDGQEYTLLGTLAIVSDGSGTPERGNYRVRLEREGKEPMQWRVESFWRAHGAWALLRHVLNEGAGE